MKMSIFAQLCRKRKSTDGCAGKVFEMALLHGVGHKPLTYGLVEFGGGIEAIPITACFSLERAVAVAECYAAFVVNFEPAEAPTK